VADNEPMSVNEVGLGITYHVKISCGNHIFGEHVCSTMLTELSFITDSNEAFLNGSIFKAPPSFRDMQMINSSP
jgi:hypothetical protein